MIKNLTKYTIAAMLISSLFITKTASAQLPGSLVPILLLKHETGYWEAGDDADGDGVVDSEDACPNVYGTDNGCPGKDSDGDGIVDSKDACPNIFGTKENDGCPLSAAEREIIRKASGNIYFESGSATIKKESYESLKELAGLLNKHPEIKTTVEGHTDKSGDDAKNMELSKKRAAAVRDFLVKNGESLDHIDSKGYGSTKPIASNETKEGKAKNRRVEVVVTLIETVKK